MSCVTTRVLATAIRLGDSYKRDKEIAKIVRENVLVQLQSAPFIPRVDSKAQGGAENLDRAALVTGATRLSG